VDGYVGEKAELRAWSSDLLVQLRARIWGIPDTSSPPILPVLKGVALPVDLSALGYVHEFDGPAFSEEIMDMARAISDQ
jgi:hypothetical protein